MDNQIKLIWHKNFNQSRSFYSMPSLIQRIIFRFVATTVVSSSLLLCACSGDTSSDPPGTNTPPIADAGTNQTVSKSATVTLDASASSDADGDLLSYQWAITSRPDGSVAELSNTEVMQPVFVADMSGEYVLSLIVNDGTEYSFADTVTITSQNIPPIANAGEDQTVSKSATVTLDGSASSNGDALTYQ